MARDPNRPDDGLAGNAFAWLRASIVLVRVGLITVIWLAMFLLAFLGYLTLPAVVLLAFLLIFGMWEILRGYTTRHRHDEATQRDQAGPP